VTGRVSHKRAGAGDRDLASLLIHNSPLISRKWPLHSSHQQFTNSIFVMLGTIYPHDGQEVDIEDCYVLCSGSAVMTNACARCVAMIGIKVADNIHYIHFTFIERLKNSGNSCFGRLRQQFVLGTVRLFKSRLRWHAMWLPC
jgi:hypothetical protein